ncbi:GNAT family N-acetyltransferase [Streptomyces sp. NPDC058304]|uniref:GNAT family N-acetyltransferase n=1 Tax=Streptomyces sp. NPDC058304 TaxID=3346437 RepID=UPI0036ED34A3
MVKLRAAGAGEAEALTALVLRSKAYWGYDAEFLASCAHELRIRAGEVADRRIVVAEDTSGGRVLGLASLEGAAPVARLGLLFVEPDAIGRGVGRQLYRDALRRAAALGFRRLLIDADPHAAGFYRAMGALTSPTSCRPGDDDVPAGLVRFEAAPAPLADWAQAWTGGGPAVHVGNVAEYNAQFAMPPWTANSGPHTTTPAWPRSTARGRGRWCCPRRCRGAGSSGSDASWSGRGWKSTTAWRTGVPGCRLLPGCRMPYGPALRWPGG